MVKVADIFFDIQNETTFVGFPSIFLHLSGGNYVERYSTKLSNGKEPKEKNQTIEQIINEISGYNCYIIHIFGGEPLNQPDILQLISILANKNYLVLVETSGELSIKTINSKAIIIMEVKCPDDENFVKVDQSNFNYLRTKDQLKFTISSSRDYHWAKDILLKQMLFEKCNILFYANEKELTTKTLAEWIITDQLPVRLGFPIKRVLYNISKN